MGRSILGDMGKPEMGGLCGVGCPNPFCALVEPVMRSSDVFVGAIQ